MNRRGPGSALWLEIERLSNLGRSQFEIASEANASMMTVYTVQRRLRENGWVRPGAKAAVVRHAAQPAVAMSAEQALTLSKQVQFCVEAIKEASLLLADLVSRMPLPGFEQPAAPGGDVRSSSKTLAVRDGEPGTVRPSTGEGSSGAPHVPDVEPRTTARAQCADPPSDVRPDPAGSASENSMEWTDAEQDRLRALWADGHSMTEIGRRMNRSTNAIIGKVHRLRLPARSSPIARAATPAPGSSSSRVRTETPTPPAAQPARPTPPSPRAKPDPAPVRLPPPSTPQPLAARHGGRTCSYPIGDPGKPGFRFCDAPFDGAGSYCAEHAAVCFEPLKTKVRVDTRIERLAHRAR